MSPESTIDEFDPLGLTCLMWASSSNQHEVVLFLLDQKAALNLTASDSGATALILAAAKGHSSVVKVLLERGANPNIRCKNGNTALLYATYGNFVTCVKLLLEKGANLAIQNEEGQSAFEVAIKCGHRRGEVR
uniref:Uncharacterized protein n=1 Tax=Capitella teleta TaxID=283909 RepID=X1Z171_CAPTE